VIPYSFQEVCKKLQVPQAGVLACYILGSRLWGTNGPKSDWDLLIIVNKLPKASEKGFLSVHQANLDALIVLKKEYLDRIAAGSFLEVVSCFLPSDHPHCLFLSKSFKPKYTPVPAQLLATVNQQTKRDLRMAEKYTVKGNLERGKKTIVHAIRVLLISLQIIQHNKIVDYTAAKNYFDEMRDYYGTDWGFYKTKFEPILQQLLNELATACTSKK